MLVLSRRVGEKIIIGDTITITVLEVRRGQVKIGVEAPRSVLIYRAELVPAESVLDTPVEADNAP